MLGGAVLIILACALDDTPVVDPVPAEMTTTPEVTAPNERRAASPGATGASTRATGSDGAVRLQLRKLAWSLAEAFKGLPGEGRFQTIAVLPFRADGAELVDTGAGTLAASEIATFLRRDHGLELVERAAIESAIAEAYLSETGVTEPGTAVKLGELLAAQALVVGEVAIAGDRVLVNARVLSTESGKVFVADQASLPAQAFSAYAQNAEALRTPWGAAFRSALIPGWGQLYNAQPVKGWIVVGLAGATLLSAGALQGAGMLRHEDYKAAGDATLLDLERNLYIARNAALIGAAGVWTYAVVDAWVYGIPDDPAVLR